MDNQYAERDIMGLDKEGGHYSRHLSAMTGEGLHDKSDIAAELAYRDARIAQIEADCAAHKAAEEVQIALRQKADEREAKCRKAHQNGRDMYYGTVEQCQDAEMQASQSGMRLRQCQDELKAVLEREAALAAYIEGLKPALEDFANGLGTCCCGDDMSRHGNPMDAGHMPTDSGWYAMERYMREKPDTSSLANMCSSKQEEALERLGQLLQETHFDKAPSVARVVMQVNDAINRVKQEYRPLRLMPSDAQC